VEVVDKEGSRDAHEVGVRGSDVSVFVHALAGVCGGQRREDGGERERKKNKDAFSPVPRQHGYPAMSGALPSLPPSPPTSSRRRPYFHDLHRACDREKEEPHAQEALRLQEDGAQCPFRVLPLFPPSTGPPFSPKEGGKKGQRGPLGLFLDPLVVGLTKFVGVGGPYGQQRLLHGRDRLAAEGRREGGSDGGREGNEEGREGGREGGRTHRSAPTAKVAMYQT